jgi:hypothetical protein
MKRTLAVAALLTITGGGTYALANSHPATPFRTTSPAPTVILEPNEAPAENTAPVAEPIPAEPASEPMAQTVAPRSGRAALPTDPAITTLPDGNLTAIAQGPSAVPHGAPLEGEGATVPGITVAGDPQPTPVVWEWRSPTAENGWTQSSEGATGCWSAYGINGRPMERQAPNEVNQHNWEVMRRQGARSIDCDSADVQAGWDPTVPLEVTS